MDELPDELENIMSNMTAQQNPTAQSGLETIQKHQQLSNLLSSTPNPSVQTAASVQNQMARSGQVTASPNQIMGSIVNSLGHNTVSRSPMQNQLVSQNKGMMPNASVGHNLQSDMAVTSGYSSIGSSNIAVNIPGQNTLTRPQGGQTVNQGAINQGHMTNGPMSGIGQPRSVGPAGALNNFQTLSQTNTVGRNNIGNNMGVQSVGQSQVAGQHNATGTTGLSQIPSMTPSITRV